MDTLLGILIVVLAIAIYFLPTIIARHKRSQVTVPFSCSVWCIQAQVGQTLEAKGAFDRCRTRLGRRGSVGCAFDPG